MSIFASVLVRSHGLQLPAEISVLRMRLRAHLFILFKTASPRIWRAAWGAAANSAQAFVQDAHGVLIVFPNGVWLSEPRLSVV